MNQLNLKSEQSEDIQIPSPTVTMPRGNRGRNGDDGDDERQDERNHYWSLRDIPKFEGKGEQPFSHLMEFEDYLVASGVTVEENENDPRAAQPDYRDIINKFKASLKNNARVWYSMYIDKKVQDLHSAEGWKTVKSKFLTYFKGEQPFSHLMEFEDYLVAPGVTVDEDEDDPRVRPDYRDIINKFKASLKNNARVWYSMYIEKKCKTYIQLKDGRQ